MILKVFAIIAIAAAFALPSVAQSYECNPQEPWKQVYKFPEPNDRRQSWPVNFDQLVKEDKLNGDYAQFLQEKHSEVKALNGKEVAEFIIWHNPCTAQNNVQVKPAVGKQVIQQYDAGSSQVQVRQNGVVEYCFSLAKNIARGALFGLGIAAPFVVPGFAGYGIGAGFGTASIFIRPKAVWVQPEFEKPKCKNNQRKFPEPEDIESKGSTLAQNSGAHYQRIRKLSKQWY